jgi:hypothetical protein
VECGAGNECRDRVDPEELGRALDAIRTDIEESRGERDARYVRSTIQLQRGLVAGGRIALLASRNKVAWIAGTALLAIAKIIENLELGHNITHGPMGLDERPGDPLHRMGVGQHLPERAMEALAQAPSRIGMVDA